MLRIPVASVVLAAPCVALAGASFSEARAALALRGAAEPVACARDLLLLDLLRPIPDTALARVAAGRPSFPDFLRALRADRPLLEACLTAGPAWDPEGAGLRVLHELWAAERAAGRPLRPELAAAVAHAWGSGPQAQRLREMTEAGETSPVSRYRFFLADGFSGRNPAFDELRSWELAWVVAPIWADADLAWLRSNVQAPPFGLAQAWKEIPYRWHNDFGDCLDGDAYAGLLLFPWASTMTRAEIHARQGGVCGAMAHFCAYAAMARGYPALTCLQPWQNHYAYAVREKSFRWLGGFFGPDGFPDQSMWGGAFSNVELAEAVCSDRKGLLRAVLLRALAHAQLDLGDRENARRSLDAAIAASPLHIDLRRERIRMLRAGGAGAARWQAEADDIVAAFSSSPRAGFALLCEISPALPSRSERLAWVERLHRFGASGVRSFAVDLEPTLEAQARFVGGDGAVGAVFRIALSANQKNGEACEQIAKWAKKRMRPEEMGEFEETLRRCGPSKLVRAAGIEPPY